MADQKISDLSAAGALTGTELIEAVQSGVNVQTTTQAIANLGGGGTSIPYGVTAGTNTYTIAATPAVAAYVDGMLLHVRVGTSSTGAVTFDFDSQGAKKVLLTSGAQAADGGLKAGVDYVVVYNSALDSAVGAFTVVNELMHGLMNLRGVYAASGGVYPSSGGSGPSGGVRHGDTWVISGTDTIGSIVLRAGDMITTAIDNPGQTASNWYVIPGYASVIGVQDFPITASAFWPRTTSGCNTLTKREIGTSLVNIQSLNFDQTTQEFAQVLFRLPKKYNLGTITYEIYWTAASGSGTVQWGVSGGAYSNDDALTVALGSAVTVDDTLLAADDLHATPVSSAVTLAGTPAVADTIVIQVSRNPASDTLNTDAEFLGMTIFITTNAANDS